MLTVSNTITNSLIIANLFVWSEQKRKYVPSKMVVKLKNKTKSITTVPNQYLTFASFLTPLRSHWLLPLREKNNLNLVDISMDREIIYSFCFNRRKQNYIE
jgi:hypothetical protein